MEAAINIVSVTAEAASDRLRKLLFLGFLRNKTKLKTCFLTDTFDGSSEAGGRDGGQDEAG